MDRAHVLRTAWRGFRAQSSGQVGHSIPFRAFLASAWRQERARTALEALVAADAVSPRARAVRTELLAVERNPVPDWSRHRALSVELFRLSVMEAPGKQA